MDIRMPGLDGIAATRLLVVGNASALIMNVLTRSHGDHTWWSQWGLLVWTVVLAVHAISVLGRHTWLGPAWEQRTATSPNTNSPMTSPQQRPADVREVERRRQADGSIRTFAAREPENVCPPFGRRRVAGR
jgi:hypothetical protein